MRAQRFNLILGQLTPGARRQVAQDQRAFANADQPQDIQSEGSRRFSNLALVPLAHHDAQPCALQAALEHFDPGSTRFVSVRQGHAGPPLAEIGDCRRAVNQDAVLLVDRKPRMRQAVCKVAIVGQQQQPFTVGVEAPHGKDAHVVWYQIDNRRTVMRVARGRNDADGLMEHQVAMRLSRRRHVDNLAVHGDHVRVGIRARSELPHDAPIDGNAPLQDQILGRAQRRHARTGQDFVQTV